MSLPCCLVYHLNNPPGNISVGSQSSQDNSAQLPQCARPVSSPMSLRPTHQDQRTLQLALPKASCSCGEPFLINGPVARRVCPTNSLRLCCPQKETRPRTCAEQNKQPRNLNIGNQKDHLQQSLMFGTRSTPFFVNCAKTNSTCPSGAPNTVNPCSVNGNSGSPLHTLAAVVELCYPCWLDPSSIPNLDFTLVNDAFLSNSCSNNLNTWSTLVGLQMTITFRETKS